MPNIVLNLKKPFFEQFIHIYSNTIGNCIEIFKSIKMFNDFLCNH